MDWIKLYRQSSQSEVFPDADLWRLWCWLLMRAAFKTNHVSVVAGGGRKTVTLHPCECITGRNTCSQELKWSPSTFERRLQKLAAMQMIEIEPRNNYSIVRILNWQKYQVEQAIDQSKQGSKGDSVTSGEHGVNRVRAGCGQGANTNKNEKKEKKSLTSSSLERFEFESFWKSFPVRTTTSGFRTKGDKQAALKQWQALSAADLALAVQAVSNYAGSGQMPKDCHRWLRDHCWNQWLETEPEATTVSDPSQWGRRLLRWRRCSTQISAPRSSILSESELTRHRVECESALVSIALRDPVAAIDRVLSLVMPDDFEDRDLAEVYDTLRDMHGAGFSVEVEACALELRKRGVIARIGKHELRQILQAGYSIGNCEYYAREVARLADHRKLLAQARLILLSEHSVKANPADLRDRFEAGTRLDRTASKASTIAQCVAKMAQAHRAALAGGGSLGMQTGFKSLDEATSGMHRQQLWLLGARSNTGKTALGVSLAGNLASGRTGTRRNVIMFSLEMSEIELAERCCADEIGINYSRFNHTTLEPSHLEAIDRYGPVFDNWPFVIVDKPSLTVE